MIEEAAKVVSLLISKKQQIATMESCTGGGLANIITCIPGASEVLCFSAVTYSNEYKVKMGVPASTIETYTVYSIETAKAMAFAISEFANSDYGVGITGKLKRIDPNNMVNQDDLVYYAIYDKRKNQYYENCICVTKESRLENKEIVIHTILKQLEDILASC